ncbi:MAG TPA: hypothetical protein VN957_27915 [Chthoniobacterales bacterium]|nr:hypothetical protein [Chthoniobacterales bacterium]
MKYICLGYLEPDKFETMSETERNALLDDIFSYDDVLRNHGHFVGRPTAAKRQNRNDIALE